LFLTPICHPLRGVVAVVFALVVVDVVDDVVGAFFCPTVYSVPVEAHSNLLWVAISFVGGSGLVVCVVVKFCDYMRYV